jgi:hypothetical protein
MPLLATALLQGGCAGVLGPVPTPVTSVRGVVREGDRTISGGWIEFNPVNGTVGNLRSARIAADGSFEADGVAVGENAIRLVNDRVAQVRYLRIFGTFTTPIRRVIPQGPPVSLKIDLVDEAIRFQETFRRGTADAAPATGEGL